MPSRSRGRCLPRASQVAPDAALPARLDLRSGAGSATDLRRLAWPGHSWCACAPGLPRWHLKLKRTSYTSSPCSLPALRQSVLGVGWMNNLPREGGGTEKICKKIACLSYRCVGRGERAVIQWHVLCKYLVWARQGICWMNNCSTMKADQFV